MSNLNNGFLSNRVLKINVGFLLHSDPGTTREYTFDLPKVRLAQDLTLTSLQGQVRLTRNTRGVLAQGHLAVGHLTECVRCLEQFEQHLDLDIEELYVYPPTPDAEFHVAESGNLDLAPLIRAEVIVQTPMGSICRPECRGLCPQCGQNLNEGPCGCEEDAIDPRLAILRDLRTND
ncbi:MAG: DUF177 domain-containing protein [Anaerolineae bacterium]|nr:DUF177 domain-containing protein [Anaerolineae bacterium]